MLIELLQGVAALLALCILGAAIEAALWLIEVTEWPRPA